MSGCGVLSGYVEDAVFQGVWDRVDELVAQV
jgi:hypothetical protein